MDAGLDYTIPRATPFTLTAVAASDPNGDALTYDWEEFDLGPAGVPAPGNALGPLFRSRPATASPGRTLPRFPDLLSGVATPWEVLPNVDRTLNFRVTVRDNEPGGGGVDYDSMLVTVSGAPFPDHLARSGRRPGVRRRRLHRLGQGRLDRGLGPCPPVHRRRSDLLHAAGEHGQRRRGAGRGPGGAGQRGPAEARAHRQHLLLALGLVLHPGHHRTHRPGSAGPPRRRVHVELAQGASPFLGAATVADLCDASVSATNDAPGIFRLGTTTVTWSATDDSGNSGSAAQAVTVVDTTPTLRRAPGGGGRVHVPHRHGGVHRQPDRQRRLLGHGVGGQRRARAVPLGRHHRALDCKRESRNSSAASQAVTVQDTTPPVLLVAVSPAELWPPNHKMVTIRALVTVIEACDGEPTVRLLSITSNEPDNGLGDGDTENDIQGAALGTDDREFQLRAERSGRGSGRVYSIVYEAADASGNRTTYTALVTVPKSQGQ